MLLVDEGAPLARVLLELCERMRAEGAALAIVPRWTGRAHALCAIGDGDALDDAVDPSVDLGALIAALAAARVPRAAAPVLARGLVTRDDAIELHALGGVHDLLRPITPFEHRALLDVVGDALGAWLEVARVRVERAHVDRSDPRALNDCRTDAQGRSTIRLRSDNGVTLAARTHALVHELGHALIGQARLAGRAYGAGYGVADYGRFLDPATERRICDEEALVRAIADAWLLRRTQIAWSRTWPGAIDDVGHDLDGDELAAFARFRLAQGLGLPATPTWPRRPRSLRS
jgi:hypothetical protein